MVVLIKVRIVSRMLNCNTLQTFAQKTLEIFQHLQLYHYFVMSSSFYPPKWKGFASLISNLPVYYHIFLSCSIEILGFGSTPSFQLYYLGIISEMCFASLNLSFVCLNSKWHFRNETTFRLDRQDLLCFLHSLESCFGLSLTLVGWISGLVLV